MISHLNKKNKPTIVDISSKKITNRIAIAQGIVEFSKSTYKKIESLKTKKGEIKSIAIIAGILGAKKTSDVIPLCHNIKIENIDIDIQAIKKISSLKVTSSVKSRGKTGVEMEALNSVSVACLTIYDMCKSIDKNIVIKDIHLVKKKGGKSDFLKSKK
jgi:cyclic pyranopterin phosphate synthase